MKLLPVLSAVSGLMSLASALSPIIIKNNAFYNSDTNERFYIRGVDYQPGGSSNLTDPLTDPETCKRDIAHFTDLGLNTIRVYSVDNTQNHDDCMKQLEDAGIYLILDVNTPDASISRNTSECSYNLAYLTEVFATVDSFAKYNNTLGFFAANELINSEDTFYLVPYVKAVTRDMKQYIKAQKYREIPVGYSAADVAEIRVDLAHYLNCGDNADERIDMLGVNDYSWCGPSSFVTSGYKNKMTEYADYSIPLFLSEYGCNKVVSSRPFTEVQAIYSPLMSSVFSGGLVYEYFQYVNKYGLVQLSGDTVTELPDYQNLKKMLASTSNPTGDGGAAPHPISQCPTDLKFSLDVPAQPEGIEDLLKKGPQGENLGFDASTQFACYDDEDEDSSSSQAQSTSSNVVSSVHSSSTSSIKSETATTSTVSSISSSSKNESGNINVSSNFLSLLAFVASLLYN